MALGGGTFLTQNKVLPGSYINFVSAAKASQSLSDRGCAAMPLLLDWGVDNAVFTVEAGDMQKDSLKLFGYDYTNEKLKDLREVFKNANKLHCYRLNSGVKATITTGNLVATAKYTGVRGNDIQIVIASNVDISGSYDVSTYLGTSLMETQIADSVDALIGNDYVDFSGTGTLTETAGIHLTGGSNKGSVDGSDYQAFLDKIEAFSFNTLGCPSTDSTIIDLFVQFTKRMREDNGIKFQTVIYKAPADYEGVISVKNTVLDIGANEAGLIYWTTGASAACAINRSNTNKKYDGEYSVDVNYKQSQLEQGIKEGHFMFHKVGDDVHVLSDINTLISYTPEKSIDFATNQVIRVLDQIANDIAVLFNAKYLGKVQNNEAGRLALWNELVSYNKQMEKIQAIENFKADDVIVEQGADKKSIMVTNPVTPVNAMTKLYMTVIVQ